MSIRFCNLSGSLRIKAINTLPTQGFLSLPVSLVSDRATTAHGIDNDIGQCANTTADQEVIHHGATDLDVGVIYHARYRVLSSACNGFLQAFDTALLQGSRHEAGHVIVDAACDLIAFTDAGKDVPQRRSFSGIERHRLLEQTLNRNRFSESYTNGWNQRSNLASC